MSKPVDYCTVEFDFLTGGASSTFMMLTSAQRYAYICAWSYAVHLRKLHLSCYEIQDRLGAIYDIDRRTVAKMLQRCCEDESLMKKENNGYTIVGVTIKHGKLENWKAESKPRKSKIAEDSTVQDRTVQESTVESVNISFELFWDAYQKKVNPGKSEKYWTGKTKIKDGSKINDADRKSIMLVVVAYIKSTPDKKFRKDPATYLYNSAWKDEIIESNGKKGTYVNEFEQGENNYPEGIEVPND